MNELKGFEPVAWMRTSGGGSRVVTEEFLLKYPEYRGDFESPLYPADQLAAVVQQRNELLAALKCAESLFDRKWNSVVGSGCEFHWQPVGNWRHYTCKMTGETFLEAITKVKP